MPSTPVDTLHHEMVPIGGPLQGLSYSPTAADIILQVIVVGLAKRRNKTFLPLLCFVLLLAAAAADRCYFRSRVYPGVYIKEIHLGGCSYREAAAVLAGLTMTFTGPRGESVSRPLHELGIVVDSRATFMEAYRQGRSHGLPRSYLDRLALWKEKTHVPLRFRLDGERLQRALLALAEAFNRPPRDARFQAGTEDTEARLVPEEPGYRALPEEFGRQLRYTLEVPRLPLQMQVPYVDIPAQLTAAALKEMGISALRSSFTTRFDISKKDRVHNIKLAASTLDGCIIPPGELFSLNGVIGDTTPEKGYRKAPVIVGEELIPGYGGGLCQLSSTLYNAALLANLEIVERHNHNLVVPYLPPGRDATIAYGARDLKFRNNSGGHILINAGVEGDTLTIWIFGAPMAERVEISTVELEVFPPPVKYRADPALPPGREERDEGTPGYVVEVWKTLYRGDRAISKERIAVDRYAPYPTVIRRGMS